MPEFRVIDCRSKVITPERKISADTPEEAGSLILGFKVMRSGPPRALAARVYWTSHGDTNMVRLYTPAGAPP